MPDITRRALNVQAAGQRSGSAEIDAFTLSALRDFIASTAVRFPRILE